MTSLQSHIHLSTELGGALEYAPTYQWRATDRSDTTMGFASVNRGLAGNLRVHVKKDEDDEPLILRPMKYILIVSPVAGFDAFYMADVLRSMYLKPVYLVDLLHVEDNLDHTPYIRPMWFVGMGDLKPFTQTFPRFYVDVMLEDARSVT